jgi:hypothetical protein
MRSDFAINEQARLVTIHAPNPGKDVDDLVARLMKDARITAGFRLLILVDYARLVPTPDDIRQISGFLNMLRLRATGRVAIVVQSAVHVTPADLIALLSSRPTLGLSGEVRAFTDGVAARAWVTADPETGRRAERS